MKNRRAAVLFVLVLCVMTASSGCGNKKESQEFTSLFEKLDTKDFTGRKADGESLAGHQLNMINIWAAWCGPCVGEMPVLNELAEEYAQEGIVGIYGIVLERDEKTGEINVGLSEKERKEVQKILDKTGVSYPQLLVNEKMVEVLGDMEKYPTTFFVDKDGRMIGEPVLGVSSKDEWKMEIAERLEMLK